MKGWWTEGKLHWESPAAKTRQWKKTSFEPSDVRELKQSVLKQLLASISRPSADLCSPKTNSTFSAEKWSASAVVPILQKNKPERQRCVSIQPVLCALFSCKKNNSSGRQLKTRRPRPRNFPRLDPPDSPGCTPNYPAGRVTSSDCWAWMAEQISSREQRNTRSRIT